jgi:hypothetical protein
MEETTLFLVYGAAHALVPVGRQLHLGDLGQPWDAFSAVRRSASLTDDEYVATISAYSAPLENRQSLR